MTIRTTGFDTNIGQKMILDKVLRAIKESIARDDITNEHLGFVGQHSRCIFITGRASSESNIPMFFHPIVYEDKAKGQIYVITDIRPYIKLPEYSENDENFVVRNQSEFDFHKRRAVLQLDWLKGESSLLKPSLPVAGVVYANWIAEAISKAFALDPKEKAEIQAVAHFFYQSLFYPDNSFDEDAKQKFSVHTIKVTGPNTSNLVFEVFDKIDKMDTLEDMVETIKKVVDNVRLQDFSVAALYNITGNAWFNVAARETLAMALEHPPTWISIVASSITDRTFRNSLIARIAEKAARSSDVSDFILSIKSVMQENNNISQESLKTEFPIFE